jgi:hypothetical protein
VFIQTTRKLGTEENQEMTLSKLNIREWFLGETRKDNQSNCWRKANPMMLNNASFYRSLIDVGESSFFFPLLF